MLAHSSPVEHGVLLVGGVLAVAVYGWAWFTTPNAPVGRLAAWACGVGAVLVSLTPAIERWAQRSFAGHMVQHLLMIAVAAPLLVVARPVRTVRVLPVVPSGGHRSERAVARWWRANGAVAAAAAFVGVLLLTHLTSIYDAALGSRWIHDLEHVAYLGSAVALWAALRSGGNRSAPVRVGAVFAVIGGSALLGVVLLSASGPLIPHYVDRLGTAGALDDQRNAAALMWVGGMATTLPLLLLTVWSWAAREERVARRGEAILDRRAERRAVERRSAGADRADRRRDTAPFAERPQLDAQRGGVAVDGDH